MTKKEIEKLFNERMKKSIEARRENHPQIKRGSYLGHDVQLFAPLDGYELLRVNNKPSDLLFIKEQCKKNFCAFVVVTTWNNGETGFITFDFTEDKKEVCAPAFIGATFSNWGTKDLIAKCFDKSGYFAELWRENLRQRAKELKRQKAQEKAEKAREEWEKADKDEAKQNILFFAQYFQDLAQDFYKKVIAYKIGFTFYIKDRYSDILELYTSALLKAEKVGEAFRNFEEVNEYIEKCKKNIKKWDMLARFTLAGEANARASYGWTWWELEKVGDRFQLVNTYESNGERFIKIKETKAGDYVGEYAEEVISR